MFWNSTNVIDVHPRRGVTLVLNCLRSGGAEKQLLWIAAEVVSFGHSCTILELTAGERTERIESMVRLVGNKGVQVLRAPTGCGAWNGLWRLRRYISESKPAIIWSWGLRADVITYASLFGNAACKRVMSIRSAKAYIGWMNVRIRDLLLRRCDGVVSNTHAGIVLSGISGIRGLRYWVLPNSVAVETGTVANLPAVQPAKWVLVMLGNIKIKTKGYDIAAQMALSLREKNFPFELRIAGRPDELPELETLFERLRVSNYVRFYGEVSRPEVFLQEGHLYILLSRFEGMPNTLLEALNLGLPAIATEVGDLRDFRAQGAPFTLIPLENVAAAVAAVESATAEWTETRAAAERGRDWVQAHFSETACRTVLRNILEELLKP
jgi:glycosyltransferase involved in cell wall biosynthesis